MNMDKIGSFLVSLCGFSTPEDKAQAMTFAKGAIAGLGDTFSELFGGTPREVSNKYTVYSAESMVLYYRTLVQKGVPLELVKDLCIVRAETSLALLSKAAESGQAKL